VYRVVIGRAVSPPVESRPAENYQVEASAPAVEDYGGQASTVQVLPAIHSLASGLVPPPRLNGFAGERSGTVAVQGQGQSVN
jgi:hypothetical protein